MKAFGKHDEQSACNCFHPRGFLTVKQAARPDKINAGPRAAWYLGASTVWRESEMVGLTKAD